MKKAGLFLTFIAVFLATVSGCLNREQPGSTEVIASVSGKHLTIDEALRNIPNFIYEGDSLAAIRDYSNQWIQSQLAVQHAEYLGLNNTPAFQQKMEKYREQVLENLLRDKIIADHADDLRVTLEEAQQYYQTHRDQFLMNERFVRLRHITTDTRTDIESANRDLINGVQWEQIVDNYSINPDYQKRFSTQFWPESMVLTDHPQLREYLSHMGITERSPITFSNGKYHLIQLMDENTENEYPDLEWLIPQIQKWLSLEKSRRIVNAYLRNLYLQAETNNEIESVNVNQLNNFFNNTQSPE